MTLEAITFDLGGMPPVEVQLASGSGLAPLPMPEAILRFRAAMEEAPEQGEMPERTMAKEQPVAPQMTAERTQPEPELRIFGRGPHVVLTEPMAADRPAATEAPVAQTAAKPTIVVEQTAVRPKETPVGVVDKPVVTPTEAPVAPEKPMVVPVAVDKPVAEVPVAPVKTIEAPVTIERSAIQPTEVPVKPVGTTVNPVEAPVVKDQPVVATEQPMAEVPVVPVAEPPAVAGQPTIQPMGAPVATEQPVAVEKPVAEVPVALVKNASDLAASVKPVKKPSVPDKPEAPAPTVQVAVPAAIDTPVPQTAAPQVAPVAQPEVLRAEAASARTATIVETVNAVVEEVAAQISVTPTLAQGEGEIRIVLKPTVLDGSEIRLSAKEGTLTVAIAPATPESAQTVAVALPRLETALAEHAPAFNQVAVVVATAKKGKTNETA